MNRRLAFIVVLCMIGALLVAATPVPEKPTHEFTGTISCEVVKSGTSDVKEKVHDTNWGEERVCEIKTDDDMAAGMMTLENLWSDFNSKQNGAGWEVQKFHITTSGGKWEGYQVTRVDNQGNKYVNGWANGETALYKGLQMWYRISADGTIQGWSSDHGEDSKHADKHPGG